MDEAKKLIQLYFKTFPKIKYTLDKLVEKAKKDRFNYSPLDKRRADLAHVDWDNNGEVAHAMNEAKNLPFQGAGASTTKKALCLIKEQIDELDYDARLINVVHDEILLEVHQDDAEEVAKMVEVQMIKAFNHYAADVPMEVKAAIGKFWIH